MASRGIQAPSAGEKRALTSAQVREAYHRRLDRHINEALDAFRSIVSSCKIQDRVSGLRGEFQSQVDTSNLCKAMEDLLRLISELKVASIVQEVTDNRQESYELRGVYDNEVKFTERAIHSICENLLPALESLEAHYYRSCTTWATNQDAVTDNDQQRDRHVANPDDVTMADDQ